MNFYKDNREIILGTVGALVIIFLALMMPIFSPELPLEKSALIGLCFSALAFLTVFITLLYTMARFRKAMAKPQIKVAFNEKGEQQATLTYKDGELNGLPSLWLINEGNAISRYFQIDFIIPENIGKQSQYVSDITRDNGKYILSYTNEGRYTLFVNRPYSDPNMVFWAAIDTKKCIEVYKDSFEIKYRIYGDWSETQEGALKVYVKKEQEASHAAG
jgi:hypothetical protein